MGKERKRQELNVIQVYGRKESHESSKGTKFDSMSSSGVHAGEFRNGKLKESHFFLK